MLLLEPTRAQLQPTTDCGLIRPVGRSRDYLDAKEQGSPKPKPKERRKPNRGEAERSTSPKALSGSNGAPQQEVALNSVVPLRTGQPPDPPLADGPWDQVDVAEPVTPPDMIFAAVLAARAKALPFDAKFADNPDDTPEWAAVKRCLRTVTTPVGGLEEEDAYRMVRALWHAIGVHHRATRE